MCRLFAVGRWLGGLAVANGWLTDATLIGGGTAGAVVAFGALALSLPTALTLVVDASVVAAALLDHGPDGVRSATTVDAARLVAPHVMASVVNVLRRAEASGQRGRDVAALAFADLLTLSTSRPASCAPRRSSGPA